MTETKDIIKIYLINRFEFTKLKLRKIIKQAKNKYKKGYQYRMKNHVPSFDLSTPSFFKANSLVMKSAEPRLDKFKPLEELQPVAINPKVAPILMQQNNLK